MYVTKTNFYVNTKKNKLNYLKYIETKKSKTKYN